MLSGREKTLSPKCSFEATSASDLLDFNAWEFFALMEQLTESQAPIPQKAAIYSDNPVLCLPENTTCDNA